MKELFSRGHKGKRKSPSARQQVTETVEKIVRRLTGTPSTSPKSCLEEDIFDKLPKTRYTYANGGGYSPRFFGRKTVTPNMSRNRLRRSRRSETSSSVYVDETDGGWEAYDEYDDFSDSESGVTTETVLEDGMELRSGKNLYNLRQMIHGHEMAEDDHSLQYTRNTSAGAMSEQKTRKTVQNQQQYSQSEHKHYSTRNLESLALTRSPVDYSNVRARRKLEGSFSGDSVSFSAGSYLQQTGGLNSSRRGSTSYSAGSSVQQQSGVNSENQGRSLRNTRTLDRGDVNGRYYKSVRTVTTVTKEVAEDTEDTDRNDRVLENRLDEQSDRNGRVLEKRSIKLLYRNSEVLEKGSVELSEKSTSSSGESTGRSQYIDHMYGLDEEDFSDRETEPTDTYRTRSRYHADRGSYSRDRSGIDDSWSTTTTVVTTITDTISTVSSAVVSPIWNSLGRPLMHHVAMPLWNSVLHPGATKLYTLLMVAWSVVTWPLSKLWSAVESLPALADLLRNIWSVVTWSVSGLRSAVKEAASSVLYGLVQPVVSTLVTLLLVALWVVAWPLSKLWSVLKAFPSLSYLLQSTWSVATWPLSKVWSAVKVFPTLAEVLHITWLVVTWPLSKVLTAVKAANRMIWSEYESGWEDETSSARADRNRDRAWSARATRAIEKKRSSRVREVSKKSGSSLYAIPLSSLPLIVWSVITWPVSTVRSAVKALTTGVVGLAKKAGSVTGACWEIVEQTVMSKVVVLDVWLFRRHRRRGCCLFLPLLLLLPLLLAVYSGSQAWDYSNVWPDTSRVWRDTTSIWDQKPTFAWPDTSGVQEKTYHVWETTSGVLQWGTSGLRDGVIGAGAAIAGFFTRDSSPPPVFTSDSKEYKTLLDQEYKTLLNQEVRNMLVQLQASDNRDRLTVAGVEAIVYRILNRESATLKADLDRQSATLKADVEDCRSREAQAQLQWKTEQEGQLGDMRTRQQELLAIIQDLEGAVAAQKASIARQGKEIKSESGADLATQREELKEELRAESEAYLANLEEKLEGLRGELAGLALQWKTEQEGQLGDMRTRQQELLAIIQDLEGAVAAQKASIARQGEEIKAESGAYLASQREELRAESEAYLVNLEEKLAGLRGELAGLQSDHTALLARVNACCHNETYYAAAIKDNVDTILAQMMAGHMSGNTNQDAFTEWLHSNYVSRETLDQRLAMLADDLTAKVLAMVADAQQQTRPEQATQEKPVEVTQEQINAALLYAGVGEQQVRQMIEAALIKYSADKTGLPDFALESAGGTVISTRCSETFEKKTALIKVFGLPLWYVSNSPRTVLQPEVYPGQCWAFKGPTGYIVIQTSTIITPTGFTLEHIPKSLAPSGEIDSAPKDFTVIGLQDEYDANGQWLGNFTYNDEGDPVQYFPAVLKGDKNVFYLYELRILNNYGNPQYTCLYRFRIHGKPYRP